MGGTLNVKSVVGQGSIFDIILPLTPVEEWSQSIPDRERKVVGFKGNPKRIMVIDDKWENRAVMVNLLAPIGFEVSEAEDGREGVKKVHEEKPDLVVMDLVMPHVDGLEATRQIRKSAEFRNLPIIASSASAFDFNRQDAIQAGCTDFLPKPIQAEELFEQLRVHLGVQWNYSTDSVQPEPVPQDDTPLIPLPQEELQILLSLAKGGNVGAIRKHLANTEHVDDQYTPFLEELRKIAKTFDMGQMTKFLMTHVDST